MEMLWALIGKASVAGFVALVIFAQGAKYGGTKVVDLANRKAASRAD